MIVMTAYDNVETTIQAMQLHAFDFIPKPIDLDQVKAIFDRATQMQVERSKMPTTEPTLGRGRTTSAATGTSLNW